MLPTMKGSLKMHLNKLHRQGSRYEKAFADPQTLETLILEIELKYKYTQDAL